MWSGCMHVLLKECGLLSGNCCRNLNPLGLTLMLSLSLSVPLNCPVSLCATQGGKDESKKKAAEEDLHFCSSCFSCLAEFGTALRTSTSPFLSLCRFLYLSLFMELPSITHTSGNAAENAVKWQLCYDMTAKTWWMVSVIILPTLQKLQANLL